MTIHAFLFSTLLVSIFGKVQAQNEDTNELVSISLHVIGKGTISESNRDIPGYFVMATVTNRQDTVITFFIMSCSWASQNWISSNDSILFRQRACDMNIPTDIHLRPHQSIQFYGVLTRTEAIPIGKQVKLGFRYITNEGDLWHLPSQGAPSAKPAIYWSNEVDLKDNLFKFQIDDAIAD